MITRPRHQAAEMQALLEACGAAVFVLPTVEIQPLAETPAADAALTSDQVYDWLIMTSANAVTQLSRRAAALNVNLQTRFAQTQIAAIGPKTAAALTSLGLTISLMPERHVAEALAQDLIARNVRQQSILTLRSQLARPELVTLLRSAGAQVDDCPLYTSVMPSDTETDGARQALLNGEIDWVSFTSASAVDNFASLFTDELPALLQNTRIASIGPVTSACALDKLGRVDLEAGDHTLQGLVTSLNLTPAVSPMLHTEQSS